MRRALFHAARGQGRTTPNPMVGAVVVSADGVPVGHGWHERAGGAHAEIHALDAAGSRARGATLYVTLEPCCHVGRTGPCTRRIMDAGIARVVCALQDPDPRVSGAGFATLRAHGIPVDTGVCEQEAARLNAAFIAVQTLGRPLVVVKAATSLDACVARRAGERTPITSPEANRKMHGLRAGVDAIAVGSETVLVDDPLLTARACQRVRPLVRVVFDRRLRTPSSAGLFSTLADGPVIIITTSRSGESAGKAAALEAAGALVVLATSLREALEALLAWDVSTLLVEGGPVLQRAFAAAGLVDRVHLVVAPQTLGADGVKWLNTEDLALSFASTVAAEPRGPDIWIEADVHRHY
ncbi:MAG TPA: bifunctional diaminohydroxyphosphoribosylaminopyrimidine deaminase/5-amino-6-(5-phosphoribosylamino)uracil reductase RibD [Vicinamibacterales bacterium]|nr:bifunctional diaminohydroxyphosphoribosylaminopyrimidine deaminase/5-amino-6-(5-phosphoribosylamino)uracil reductase RibD [Vicinamibacterales bacterium]